MTISLVAAFIPVLFMSGMLGRILARICRDYLRRDSGVGLHFVESDSDALPAVTSVRRQNQKHGWLYRFLGRGLDLMNRGYGSDSGLGHETPRHDDGGLVYWSF